MVDLSTSPGVITTITIIISITVETRLIIILHIFFSY
jgi:hypothetical protein